MAALGEGGVKLIADLEGVGFRDISIEGTAATVVARETWVYTQVRIGDGLRVAQGRVTYDLRYDMQRQDGRWLVAKVTAFGSKESTVAGSSLPTTAVPLDRPLDVPRGSTATGQP
jgi:hypothetical protein